MKNHRKKNQFYGKPKRRDFSFNRFFNDQKSGINALYENGKCVKLGTHESEKLPIRQFIPSHGMNRRQRRMRSL